jgi:hypothetical protein
MIKVLVSVAGSAAVVCAPAAWADVLYLGGTGQQGRPTQDAMAWLVNDGIVDPDKLVGINYPADLWPVVGPLSLDESVAKGTNRLDRAIPKADGPVSQGAVVINYEKRRLMKAPNPRADVSFVTLGDPTNSDGGILAKLPPMHIPVLDFTITPPPVDTPQYPTTEIVREFDGFADWPDHPFNALADLNALAGIVYLHPDYGGRGQRPHPERQHHAYRRQDRPASSDAAVARDRRGRQPRRRHRQAATQDHQSCLRRSKARQAGKASVAQQHWRQLE